MDNTKGFICIQSWMLDLELSSDKELIIYALIFGISQDGESEFTGSIKYLQSWIRGSKDSVIRTLKSLVDKKYVIKTERTINGVKFNSYKAADLDSLAGGGSKLRPGVANCDQVSQNATEGLKMRHNNIDSIFNTQDIYTQDTKERNSTKKESFTPPTVAQVKEYCESRNNGIDAEEFVAFYTSNGWMVGKNKMKDWKSAVITWEKNRKKEKNSTRVSPKDIQAQLREDAKYVNNKYEY